MSYSRLNRPSTHSLVTTSPSCAVPTTNGETPQEIAAREINAMLGAESSVTTTDAVPSRPRLIYCIGYGTSYCNWMQGTLTRHMEEADLVVLTGGADIGGLLHSDTVHPQTYSDSERDRYEIAQFEKAVALQKCVWGTCRGFQLIGALAGARIVQHQDNPRFMHDIVTHDGLALPMSSCHHQAVAAWNLPASDWKLLSWSAELQSSYHEDGHEREMVLGAENEKVTLGREIEGAIFPKLRATGTQGHLEMIYRQHGARATVAYYQAQLTRFIASGGTSVDVLTPAAPVAVTA